MPLLLQKGLSLAAESGNLHYTVIHCHTTLPAIDQRVKQSPNHILHRQFVRYVARYVASVVGVLHRYDSETLRKKNQKQISSLLQGRLHACHVGCHWERYVIGCAEDKPVMWEGSSQRKGSKDRNSSLLDSARLLPSAAFKPSRLNCELVTPALRPRFRTQELAGILWAAAGLAWRGFWLRDRHNISLASKLAPPHRGRGAAPQTANLDEGFHGHDVFLFYSAVAR